MTLALPFPHVPFSLSNLRNMQLSFIGITKSPLGIQQNALIISRFFFLKKYFSLNEFCGFLWATVAFFSLSTMITSGSTCFHKCKLLFPFIKQQHVLSRNGIMNRLVLQYFMNKLHLFSNLVCCEHGWKIMSRKIWWKINQPLKCVKLYLDLILFWVELNVWKTGATKKDCLLLHLPFFKRLKTHNPYSSRERQKKECSRRA